MDKIFRNSDLITFKYPTPFRKVEQINSIEFINSLCFIKKKSSKKNKLGKRVVVGESAVVVPDRKKLNNLDSQTI